MARPRKNEETASPWVVRDVPEATRRKVRIYAAAHNITMAQAIEQLIDKALPAVDLFPNPELDAGFIDAEFMEIFSKLPMAKRTEFLAAARFQATLKQMQGADDEGTERE